MDSRAIFKTRSGEVVHVASDREQEEREAIDKAISRNLDMRFFKFNKSNF